MKTKIIALALVAAILGLALIGCGRSQTPSKKIGFVMATLANPYFVDMMAGAKTELAKHPGYELVIQAPEKAAETEREIQIIENLCVQRVAVLCVVPVDSKSIVPAIKKANRAGIPVINVDSKIDSKTAKALGASVVGFIVSDNFEGGRIAGAFIADKLHGKGKVAILEGISGLETATLRKNGCLEAFKKTPGIEVVASLPADWEREKGMNVFQNILQAHPDLDAVFACNDEMALGAIRALNQPRKVIVVGFDATAEARQAVEKGLMDATVAQQPYKMGQQAVADAIRLIEGKTNEPKIETPVKLVTK